MKKVWLTSIILSGAMAAGLYAQQSSPSQSSSDKVTVQGCVEHAQAGATGTTGTTGSTASGSATESGSASGAQFVLTNVSNSNTPAAGTTGTTGSTASPSSSAPTPSQYQLDDSGQNRLASYVGQKVEVTGSVESSDMASSAGSTAGSAAGSTASSSQSASSNESNPKLKVDSIRMIASSCSGF